MKITIIGWYGTETIGDRTILAGLYNMWAGSLGVFEIRLGCLDTVLSERTLDEDYGFFKECAVNDNMKLALFDSRKKKELDDSIKWADIVTIGGGPLMGIPPLYMLLYAFKKARKLHKKTVVAGCGMGPFPTPEYLKVAVEIIDCTDLAIFRDSKSQTVYNENSTCVKRTYAAVDPAVFAARHYVSNHPDNVKEDFVAINFREPTAEYSGIRNQLDDFLLDVVCDISTVSGQDIRLIPMHTFDIGGDDRYILNRIKRKAGKNNIFVENRPLSLVQTLKVFGNALFCVGMRFHSVLLQTVLNGKNFILDYTDPEKGKTINLLYQLQLADEYKDRYFSLVSDNNDLKFDYLNVRHITVSDDLIDKYASIYKNAFKQLL